MRRRKAEQLLDPIRRGTTPTCIFKRIPYPRSLIKGGTITFSQRGQTVFTKSFFDDCVTWEGDRILVDLTEEETLQLTTYDLCRAQIRFDLPYEKKAASGIYKIPVHGILEGGED